MGCTFDVRPILTPRGVFRPRVTEQSYANSRPVRRSRGRVFERLARQRSTTDRTSAGRWERHRVETDM